MAVLTALCLFLTLLKEGANVALGPTAVCKSFRSGPSLDVHGLVGSWMTVYTQPKSLNCFNLHIRAVTDLEREQYMTRYGTFNGRVNYTLCLLEVVSSQRKHLLQGDGAMAGVLENVIVTETPEGKFTLQEETADQWTLYGRRGSELLLMRDCGGEIAALFGRIPYWPTPEELYGVLHRSGIGGPIKVRQTCRPNMPMGKCPDSILDEHRHF